MSNVFIQPGETIMVQTGENQFTRVSYEALLGLTKHNTEKPRKNKKTVGGKLSRRVALVANLVRTGKWSTGAKTDISSAVDGLITEFMNAPNEETNNISNKAVESLIGMIGSRAINNEQKTILRDIVAEVELRREECA